MTSSRSSFLVAGAAMSALAAVLHLGCIVFGPSWYRFLGGGEQMAELASTGHWYPTVVTLAIATVLALWSLYALSGAGVIRRLPLVRVALYLVLSISSVFVRSGPTYEASAA